jgi:hypothetical protein
MGLRFTTYEYLPTLLTLRSLFTVSHKSYLLMKRSYLLRVHLRLRFRLTTFSETVASSLKERKKNKFYISKHVPICVIFTHFRRLLGPSYPYMPKVQK